MPAEHLFEEIALHKKWEKDPKYYNKPARPDALAPRAARLINVPASEHSLSYVLFIDGKKQGAQGSGAYEFLFDDPEPIRKATIPHIKSTPGFRVYYKHGPFWYGCWTHFPTLNDAIPYLQGGHRVLIEYRFTK